MKKFQIALLSACFFQAAIGQPEIAEFGKVDIKELSMKECAFEPTASAMNLIATAKINFQIGTFSLVPQTKTQYRYRIKIFSQKGFDAGSIKIPYFSEDKSSKVTDIEGYIYNLDGGGKIIREKLEKKEIYQQKSKARKTLNSVSFTFKQLKAGSVIEYRYTRIDKYSFSPDPWFFQDQYPTAVSTVTISRPSYLGINYHFVSFDDIQKDSSLIKHNDDFYDEDVHTFTSRNIHSFREEPFMGSLRDNLERVEFAVSDGGIFRESSDLNNILKWIEFNDFLLRSRFFGGQFAKTLEGTYPFIDSVKRLKNKKDRIAAVYSFVKGQIKWNDEYTFYCDSLERCWKLKSGSSAEMNILLLDLLRKSEINCFPILVSTTDHGKADETFPSLSQFDNVDIIAIDNKDYYILDCTQKSLSFVMPPRNVLNSKAFVIDGHVSKWIYITETGPPSQSDDIVNLNMDSTGIVTGESFIRLIGAADAGLFDPEQNDKDKSPKDKNDVQENREILTIDSIIEENDGRADDTFRRRAQFHFTASNTGATYFLNPMLFSNFKKNPFIDTARLHDIDFGFRQTYFVSLHLRTTDNFTIEDYPKKTSIRMQDSSMIFRREVFANSNEILIRITFTVNNPYFDKANYGAVRTFFEKIYALINEEIVLKKI